MAHETIKPPRELTNKHTLIAQQYAGYLVGHPYRNVQQTTTIEIDRRRRWREPAIIADDCIFCARLTDEEAVRRVAGFQYQIDIEATRTKRAHFMTWIDSGSPDVPEPRVYEQSAANLRRFCELFQDMPTKERPNGWRMRPLPLIALPLRLKRKLCVEWNHIYLPWMEENGLQYDFEQHQFYREVTGRPVAADRPAEPDLYDDDDAFFGYD